MEIILNNDQNFIYKKNYVIHLEYDPKITKIRFIKILPVKKRLINASKSTVIFLTILKCINPIKKPAHNIIT